jgi:2-haloacid dehalogenase
LKLGQYESFFQVTRNALLHALAENGVKLGPDKIDQLMESYDSLSAFPDVSPALALLATKSNIKPVVFSNGTKSMVFNSVHRSKDLFEHAATFHDLVTVDEVRKFKPAPEVYFHLAERVGKSRSEMSDIWLVSGNPFDVLGARNSGMQAAWVDRRGLGWIDSAMPYTRPTAVIRDLGDLTSAIEENLRAIKESDDFT